MSKRFISDITWSRTIQGEEYLFKGGQQYLNSGDLYQHVKVYKIYTQSRPWRFFERVVKVTNAD